MSIIIRKFGATWCKPCKALADILKDFKLAHPHIEIEEIDIEESPDLAEQQNIRSIPVLQIVRDGHVLETLKPPYTVGSIEEAILNL